MQPPDEGLLAELSQLRERVRHLEGQVAAAEAEAARLRASIEVERALSEASVDLLARSEERFRTLIEGLQVGVVVQGPQAEILLSNPAALEMLGLSEEQLLGKTSFDPDWNIIREDGSAFHGSERPVAVVLRTGLPVLNVTMGIYRPARRDRVWILVSVVPERGPDGEIKQVVATLTDITERKRIEERLRSKDEVIAELSSPFLPIREDIVVMPLVGRVDAARASQALETLLRGVVERRVRVAILDVTGVPALPAEAASGLLKAAGALRLVGVEMVITGVRPALARSLVDIGVDMSDVVLRSTLQSGVAFALQWR